MIGQSRAAYIFIRTFISFLRSITPLSIAYWLVRLTLLPKTYRLSLALELTTAAEAAFYLLVFLPKQHALQRPAQHPQVLSQSKRQDLFRKCLDTVPNVKEWLRLGAQEPVWEVKRENVKEWLCWAFLNKHTWTVEESEELDNYVTEAEAMIGEKFQPGRGRAVSLRITLDDFTTMHRPLIWYVFMVGGHDFISHIYLLLHSFHLHRRPLSAFFFEFPLRPLALLSRHVTPATHISYWHRPHTSKTRIPVVLIHGVGIGLHTYMRLMSEFNEASDADPADGDIGFIALEIQTISFRLTHEPLGREELCREILSILQKHGWDNFVLVGQSYGTIISAHMLHDHIIAPKISALVLFDPVAFLLHLPQVAYNFTRRLPQKANEHQLYFFASTDIGIAHTLARHTFWSECILWKEELGNRRATVILGAKDIVVASDAVGRYMTRPLGIRAVDDDRGDEWRTLDWTGEGIDVLWFPDNDHGEVIDTNRERRYLINAIMMYCKAGGQAILK